VVNLFGCAIKRRFISGLSAILLSFALVSCSDIDGDPEDLIGIAATGAATQGTVFVVDAEGTEISKTINTDGFYRFDVRGMIAPFMLKSVASNGVDPDLYSYAAEANVTANITPLTNLAVYIANGNSDLSILYDSWASSFVNIAAADITNAQATVNANLSTQYTAYSLDPQTYDFFATIFSTSSTGIDALIEALTIDTTAGISIAVTGIADALVFNPDIDILGYDIGGDSVATIGAYTLVMNVSVDSILSSDLLLSINFPASSVPITGSTQIVEDIFSTFYGSLGPIVINSVTVTIGEELETIAVVDATISTDEDGDVNYIATYTYTLNVE